MKNLLEKVDLFYSLATTNNREAFFNKLSTTEKPANSPDFITLLEKKINKMEQENY